MRIPTRFRQAPRLALQILSRSVLLQRPMSRRPIFRLCYFCCRSYFPYLYCSLDSLLRCVRGISYEVIVFSDKDQPLSDDQCEVLSKLFPNIRIIEWPKSMGWGIEQIGWIWKAYAIAAEGLEGDDIVARVDADVFFFNDRIFREAARANADLIGDGHFVDFRFCQGGTYFLRVGAVRRVLQLIEAKTLENVLQGVPVIVEDVAVHHMITSLGLHVRMTCFMMFPDEYRNAGGLTSWSRWKFSCLHFVMKNKPAMLDAYFESVLPVRELDQFRILSNTP